MKTMLVAAAMATAFAATSASAALIIVTPGTTTTGPFSDAPGNNFTGFTPIELNNQNTYDWAFSLVAPISGSVGAVQIQAQAQASAIPENITFDLYAGTPGVAGAVFQGSSSTGTNAELTFTPSVGPYYIEVTPAYIKQGGNNEGFSGTLMIAVPEPATWALMLVGFGGMGAALRRRAAKAVAA
jgi:hypothetical protein